jgi:L-ascorbate metabolism protein UlaG (beta-lactamase superfamily)
MITKGFSKLYLVICLYLLVYSLSSCSGALKAKKLEYAISQGVVDVQLSPTANDQVTFHYTGCSGFLIEYRDQAILHDPFFSYVGPLFTLNTRVLVVDTAQVQSFFQSQFPTGRDEQGKIKMLLVSHTHYDHMLDVPYIYQHLLDKDTVRIYGSADMRKVMTYNADTPPDSSFLTNIIVVEDDLSQMNKVGRRYKSRNGKIQILPIYTEHAPHFYGLHFFKGEIGKNPKRAYQWKEGANVAYLVDFLADDGTILFRTYLTAAAANEPAGFVPPSVLAEHPIDVAVLCVASYAYVKDYPIEHLQNLNPRHLILSHWENFFQAREKLAKRPMLVPFTNVKAFLKRVDANTKKLPYTPAWTMPDLGTAIRIRF